MNAADLIRLLESVPPDAVISLTVRDYSRYHWHKAGVDSTTLIPAFPGGTGRDVFFLEGKAHS